MQYEWDLSERNWMDGIVPGFACFQEGNSDASEYCRELFAYGINSVGRLRKKTVGELVTYVELF
ncbi:hypothetical protein NFHSH190041_23390 [Shewanella sp. NFH-SH190041]|nr:hypothetical protein NFHSH190041_23390 [Shewanella sp. NFH-SH190041]